MAGSQGGQAIPTQLGPAQFQQFVLPHLSIGSRGPAPKLTLFKIFNYILRQLYMGCQWKEQFRRATQCLRMSVPRAKAVSVPHPSPHFVTDRSPPNRPLLTSISANRWISGSSRCSGMFGISS